GTLLVRLRRYWSGSAATGGGAGWRRSGRLGPVGHRRTSLTPHSLRGTSDRRNAIQPAPSSCEATSRPSTSRWPSALTPTAISACTLTVRPASRHLIASASTHTNVYGPASNGRLRNA